MGSIGKNARKCLVCGRKTEGDEFCEAHKKTQQNVIQGYEQWTRALKISWEKYLDAVAKNPNTGLWVREIVDYLQKRRSAYDQPKYR